MYAAEKRYDELILHNDARKFETGTIAYSLFNAWSAGLELLLEVGIKNVYEKALENTDLLLEGLTKKGYQIVTPTRKREERTAIVHFNTGAFDTTKALYEKLTVGVHVKKQGLPLGMAHEERELRVISTNELQNMCAGRRKSWAVRTLRWFDKVPLTILAKFFELPGSKISLKKWVIKNIPTTGDTILH
jgi:hypothetical protein